MDQNYTLKFKLGNSDPEGLRKVYLKYYSPLQTLHLEKKTIRLLSSQFDPKKKTKNPVKNHPDADRLNRDLDNFRVEVEARLLTANGKVSKDYLEGRMGTSDLLMDFIKDFIDEKKKENANAKEKTARGARRAKSDISDGRLRIYNVMRNKVTEFDKSATFRTINKAWLQRFESHLRAKDIGESTLDSNMDVIKAILGHAKDRGYISKEQIEGYSAPGYDEDIPEFLEEHEILAFANMARSIENVSIKISGFYFLLGCYAGYRIGDLFAFDYEYRVRSNFIVLRATKNGKIVSIPIFPELREVLDFVKENKLTVTEETMRKHVKLIARLIGIKHRNIKVHTARHSFAMMWTIRGLNIDEVAELLGDSVEVARRYARVLNAQLHKRVLEVRGGISGPNP